ncbi:MAG: Ig-like domain-containing protein [Lachnotalea sp.]
MKTINKMIAFILSIVVLMGAYTSVEAEETQEVFTTGSGLSYIIDANNEIMITGYSGTSTNMVIPDTIEGNTVIAIGAKAFINNNTIETVKLPETLKELGRLSFWSCENLVEIEIPRSVELIGTSSFQLCSSLRKIIIYENTELEEGTSGNRIFSNYTRDFKIYGYKDSPAEAYSKIWNDPFVYNDRIPLTDITLPDEITVNINEKTEIPVTFTPENSYVGFHKADNYTFTGTSDADLEITDEGKVYVTGKAVGQDNLSLKKFAVYNYMDNHITSNVCKINIVDPSLINATTIYLKDGDYNTINNTTLNYDTYVTGCTYPLSHETTPLDANENIIFTSTNEYTAKVSLVDGNYVLTVSNAYILTPRTCTITATGKRSGVTASFDVSVFYGGAASITFDSSFENNKQGKVNRIVNNSEYEMPIKVVPETLVNNSTVSITQNPQTEGETVVTYDTTTSILKAIGVGTATLKAECEGQCVSYDFEVLPYENKATRVTIDTNDKVTKTDAGYALALKLNDVYQFSATVVPEETTDIFKWHVTSNDDVVSIDRHGNVTALKVGTATIKASSCSYLEEIIANAQSEYITVTVTDPNAVEEPDTPVEILAKDIKLSQSDCQMNVGQTLQLTPILTPRNTTETPTFYSNNTAIATISDTGLVTIVGTGTVNIAVQIRGMFDIIEITVKAPIISPTLTINTTSVVLKNGETYTMAATVSGNTNVTPITWDTENVNVASVSESGNIVAKGAGSTRIIATMYCFDTGEYYKLYCDVTVTSDATVTAPITVQGITLNTISLVLEYGDNNTLIASLYPQGVSGFTAWTSNNIEVATVTNGQVIAKGPGTCQITASSNGKSAICTITVNKGSIKLNAKKFKLQKGKTTKALVISKSSNANDKIKSVKSSSKSVKASLKNGIISLKGVKTGTKYTNITVTMESGATATCKVKVVKSAVTTSKLKLNKKKATLKKGEYTTLEVTQTPISATDKITWTSSNKKVATVNKKGKIVAKKKGKATITLKSASGKKVTCKIIVK